MRPVSDLVRATSEAQTRWADLALGVEFGTRKVAPASCEGAFGEAPIHMKSSLMLEAQMLHDAFRASQCFMHILKIWG